MRVLSIDGGGIRGLIPALVLADIERRTGRPISQLFDLVAGTSTGALLACTLARPDRNGKPRYTAAELTALYQEEGPRIFARSLGRIVRSAGGVLDERYSSDGLVTALYSYLGYDRLSDALVDLLITAYEIEDRVAFLMRTSRARRDPSADFRLADAAHASSAAPGFFEPARIRDSAGTRSYSLIDGGVFASTPAGCAVAELGEDGTSRLAVLASLGTGEATRPIPASRARNWGALGWTRPMIDILLSGQAETVDVQMARLLADRYVRLQIRLEGASDSLDDTSPANLRALRSVGERLIRERAGAIDALCETLVGSTPPATTP